jgi:hypothetical protein
VAIDILRQPRSIYPLMRSPVFGSILITAPCLYVASRRPKIVVVSMRFFAFRPVPITFFAAAGWAVLYFLLVRI